MRDSIVDLIAEKTGFFAAWDLIESSKVKGEYLNNMEYHYVEVKNAEFDGRDIEAIATSRSFESVEHMLTSVMNQSLEDLELRSFG